MAKTLSVVCEAEEFWPAPAGAGDREGDLRQAGIGLAVPSKAICEDSDPLHLAVPFAPQHSARPQVRRTPGQIHGALPCVLRRHRTVEQTLALAIQITQHIGLQPIRQNAEQEVAGQVGVWSPPEYVMSMASKPPTSRSRKRAISPSSVFPVRQGRTDLDARHGAQDDWPSDLRGRCLLLSTPAML